MTTMTDVQPQVLGTRVGWGARVWLGAAALGALVFWFAAALPYFLLDQAHLDQYSSRHAAIFVHIIGGTIALLTGPVQLWLGLADRRIDVHRRLGQIYMIAVLVSALAAYYLALHTEGGWVFGAGLAGLATA